MTKYPRPIHTVVGRLAGSLLVVAVVPAATACGSTTSTSPPTATTTATAATTATSAASSSAGLSVGKPGCSDAVAAFQDATGNLGTKIHDLPSLQAFVADLVTRLRTAAAKSTDSRVRSAVDKVADDLGTLETDAQNNDGAQVQAQLSTLVSDGQA